MSFRRFSPVLSVVSKVRGTDAATGRDGRCAEWFSDISASQISRVYGPWKIRARRLTGAPAARKNMKRRLGSPSKVKFTQ